MIYNDLELARKNESWIHHLPFKGTRIIENEVKIYADASHQKRKHIQFTINR